MDSTTAAIVLAQGIGWLVHLATVIALALLFWRLHMGIGWVVSALLVPLVAWLGISVGGVFAISQGIITPIEYAALNSLQGLILPAFLIVLLVRVWSRYDPQNVFD